MILYILKRFKNFLTNIIKNPKPIKHRVKINKKQKPVKTNLVWNILFSVNPNLYK